VGPIPFAVAYRIISLFFILHDTSFVYLEKWMGQIMYYVSNAHFLLPILQLKTKLRPRPFPISLCTAMELLERAPLS
jgi:hypothetical protein